MSCTHTFDRNGFATLEDLKTQEWKRLFDELETVQTDFLSANPHPPDYPWPKDSLHTWSRVWEYPYAIHQVRKHRKKTRSEGQKAVALDFGSGVTFFPFVVARENLDVVCVDRDPTCGEGISSAATSVIHSPGRVSFRLTNDSRTIPVETESVNILYSLSVLEHLPDPSALIDEFARVLSPSGLLILTFDIAIEPGGVLGLNPEARLSLLSKLSRHFVYSSVTETVHPAALLTTVRGPYPMYKEELGLQAVWRATKEKLIKPYLHKPPRTMLHLGCEGLTCEKR